MHATTSRCLGLVSITVFSTVSSRSCHVAPAVPNVIMLDRPCILSSVVVPEAPLSVHLLFGLCCNRSMSFHDLVRLLHLSCFLHSGLRNYRPHSQFYRVLPLPEPHHYAHDTQTDSTYFLFSPIEVRPILTYKMLFIRSPPG